jgi:hypothetical protein
MWASPTRKNIITGFVVELDDEGESVGSDELGDCLSGGQLLGQVVPSFIELLEEDDSLAGINLELGEEGLGGGDGKLLVVHDCGNILEGLGSSSVHILVKKTGLSLNCLSFKYYQAW